MNTKPLPCTPVHGPTRGQEALLAPRGAKHDIDEVAPATAAKVVIYTTAYCGYCFAAKRLLDGKGVAYQQISADRRPDLRAWLIEALRQRTVPQVFINGQNIGGYTELAGLEARGELDELLAATPPVDNPALPS